jgi:multiple sugar transport system permease protein
VRALWYGYVTGPVLGVLWAFVAATTLAVCCPSRPAMRSGRALGIVVMGALVGLAAPDNRAPWLLAAGAAVIGFALSYTGFSPIHVAGTVGAGGHPGGGRGVRPGAGLARVGDDGRGPDGALTAMNGRRR